MAKTAMTHARLTPEIKEKAEAILKELGISISQAMQEARNGKGERYDSVEKMLEDLKV